MTTTNTNNATLIKLSENDNYYGKEKWPYYIYPGLNCCFFRDLGSENSEQQARKILGDAVLMAVPNIRILRKDVREDNYRMVFQKKGSQKWVAEIKWMWVNTCTLEAVKAETPKKGDLLKIISRGWDYWSGHRNSPGSYLEPVVEEALYILAPGWRSKMEEAWGPSSYGAKIHVKGGKIFADDLLLS